MSKYAIKYDKKKKLWYRELNGLFNSWIPLDKAVSTNNGTYQYNSDGTKTLLTKPKPSAQHLTNNAWRHENPTEKGKRGNLYFPFNTNVKDKNKRLLHDIGAGINLESQTTDFLKNAWKGMTRQELDDYTNAYYLRSLDKVELLLPLYTSMPDTISPLIKEGLADIDYLMGNVGQFKKLMTAVAQGNYPQIIKESVVKFGPERKADTRRHQLRLQDYFHYNSGGILKFQSPSQLISRATNEYYIGTGLHFVKGNLLKPSDLNYSIVQRKGLDKNYLVDKNGGLVRR